MKTQLIQLDPYDDVISVRDKMGWSQTSRILLVWPERSKILTRQLDLLQLQRYSASLGAQLALVTNDPIVREVAQALNLPIFETTLQAQSTRWRSRRRRHMRPRRMNPPPEVTQLRQKLHPQAASWQDHPAVRFSLFSISVVAILALVLVFLPTARITLQPEVRLQSFALQVSAGNEYEVVNLAGELPTEVVTVVVEGRDSLTTTGSMMIPVEQAIGAVMLTNLTNEPVSVPSGLIVSTLDANPVRFITTQTGDVPAGAGWTITLSARAVAAGETGNLPAASLVAVEGDLGLQLAVTNRYPTHGGSSAPAPAPNAVDHQRLAERLTNTLQDTALADLQDSLPEGDLLLPTTMELANLVDETYIPADGLPGDQLDLTLRLEYKALVVTRSNLQSLLGPIMDGNLPSGFLAVPETLNLVHTAISSPNPNGIVHWTLSAKRNIRANISSSSVINLAIGQPVSTIASHLAARLSLEDTPSVKLYPSWWPRMPYLPFRIEVITN
jgi:hypothetical protein